ncbi:MAG TPA: hypothetical protein VIP77_17145 [Jiangellaceae bacterium]
MSAQPPDVRWSRREPPLEVAGACGVGEAARRLRTAVEDRLRAGADLRVASSADALVVLGEAGALPWTDGVTYLGWEGAALLPTTLRSAPSADLLLQALSRSAELVVIVPGHILISPMPVTSADPDLLGSE